MHFIYHLPNLTITIDMSASLAGDDLSIVLDNVACEGTETSLADCPGISWGSVSSECTHSDDAGVVCTDGQFDWLVL